MADIIDVIKRWIAEEKQKISRTTYVSKYIPVAKTETIEELEAFLKSQHDAIYHVGSLWAVHIQATHSNMFQYYRRKSWVVTKDIKQYISPVEGHYLYYIHDERTKYSSGGIFWCPTVEDILADDWEVFVIE